MSEAPRFLITTADERTWKFDCPSLFLGEWCRLYDRKHIWQGMDAEVVPYHWDDRERYFRDYAYLKNFYESILVRTGDALNRFHAVNHSTRYWRIVIGPWLYLFLQVLFDRWVTLQKAVDDFVIDGTVILLQPESEMIPCNMLDFQQLIWSDSWNHFICGNIIKTSGRIKWEERNSGLSRSKEDFLPVRKSNSLKWKLYKATAPFLAAGTRKNDAFIIQGLLPRLTDMLLQISLGQLPKEWHSPCMKPGGPDFLRRGTFKLAAGDLDDFSQFVCSMIPRQIPVAYLEGYAQLVALTRELPWPSKPKVIFTANAYESDEVFKAWTAEKTELGVPLVIGQHGGFFGVGKWGVGEDHQVEIADRFLTWGWSDLRKSIYPAMALANLGKPCGEWRRDGHLLLVTVSVARYCWKSSSWPTASGQSNRFLDEQLRFARLLPPEIRGKLIVRMNKRWDEIQKTCYWRRWNEVCPEAVLDPSTESIEPQIRACRLYVSTYNATTFLTSLGRNIPTIMFWDPACMELRDSAKPYFDCLKEVGIFHETPESAAAQVVEVWDSVATWWNRPEVQRAREFFCAQYARMPEKIVPELKQALLLGKGMPRKG